MAGWCFHPNSPRHVGLEQARALADQIRGRLKIVALIADQG
jgi:phosphoribosylanthranilate isomerase